MMADDDAPGGGDAGGNIFTRKLGPLPMWAWMGIGLGGALAFTSWSRNKKAAADAKDKSTSGTLPTTQTASGSTPASLIPQFVNQVYTQGTPPAVTQPSPATPAASNDQRTVLNPIFNEVGWNDKAKQSPWTQTVAQPGESWKDITARIYKYGANYAAVTDPEKKKRIDEVSDYIKRTNSQYTGETPNGNGPTPGSIVTYR